MLLAAADSAYFQGGLTSLDHAVIALYLLAMLAMGFSIARRQKSTEDFFVGGRNLPSWAVGISLIASLLSTITYLGMPGEMFRTGIGFLTRQLSIPFVLLIVWFLWIPFFMRLNLTSAYEYLERRFNYPVRALAAVFCLLLLLGWISVVVLTASKAMVEIADLDLEWFFGHNRGIHRDADMHAVILSVGLFSVLYTTMGGIRAVIWTDVIQFLVLICGALFTMGMIAWRTGSGVGDWIDAQQAYGHRETVEWFSWDVTNRSTVFTIAVGMFFWHMCTHGANQVALQRYFTVNSVWGARRSFLVNALSSIGLGIVLAGVGIALMYFIEHHDLPEITATAQLDSPDGKIRNEAQDSIFPQFIRSSYFPAGLRGLVVAALFAAAMSTIDSGANSISTILTVDFFRRLSPPERHGMSELRLARIVTAGIGLAVVAGTVFLYHFSKGTNLVDLCQRGFNCFLGPLGALFVLALFSRSATARTVIPAVLIGEIVGIGTSYCQDLTSWLADDYGGVFAEYLGGEFREVDGESRYAGLPFSTHLVIASSWLTTIVISHLLALVGRTQVDPQQQRWMWRAVVGDREK